jgi:hypothetical protein
MSIRALALASLFLFAAASICAAEDLPLPDKAPDALQWREFHFPDCGFVVSFPGATSKPKVLSTPVSGLNPLLQQDYQVSVGDDTVYSVVVFQYPEGRAPNPPRADYYVKVISAYAKGSETNVRKKGPIMVDGRPGYEAIAEDGRGNLNHLIDIVANGDRVYMIVSAGPKGHAKSKDAERFRDSFRLLGGPPPPRPVASDE